MPDIDEIIGNFTVLDDWDDRYRYVIELGRELAPLSEAAHSDANNVQGCASQVWLDTTVRPNGAGGPVLTFAGDSDAHIVRGLIAILFAIYSGKSAREILSVDAIKLFEGMGLREHLTPQRSNGFRSMVDRIRSDGALVDAGRAGVAVRSGAVLGLPLGGAHVDQPARNVGQGGTRALAHAGEAIETKNKFAGLNAYDQGSIIEFLKSLRVLPPDTKALAVDEDGHPVHWPPEQ